MFFKKINVLLLSFFLNNTKEAKETKNEKIDFAVGGQAVIEGVMMRSPSHITIAVRKPDGSIKTYKRSYQSITKKIKYLNIFIIRGVINLFEMMAIGIKAINWSASAAFEEAAPSKENPKPHKSSKFRDLFMLVFSLIFAIGFSLLLFKFLPLLIATYFGDSNNYINEHYLIFNLIDGASKLFIFLGYIFVLTLIPDFRRIFKYHGAEHKSIFTYENKLPLTVENAKKQTRFHPRCGTSFILIVIVFSIIVYMFIPKQESFLTNLLLRIAVLPLVAGISYEYLKLSAKYSKNAFVKILVAPGLWFQRLTTKEPSDAQLEVGLESLKLALKEKET